MEDLAGGVALFGGQRQADPVDEHQQAAALHEDVARAQGHGLQLLQAAHDVLVCPGVIDLVMRLVVQIAQGHLVEPAGAVLEFCQNGIQRASSRFIGATIQHARVLQQIHAVLSHRVRRGGVGGERAIPGYRGQCA